MTSKTPSTSVAQAFQQLQAQRPDKNLDSNILKLCSGLRAQGLVSYANTLEKKFLQYKQANALYDVSGESGEDVVNQAHPDGSHAMENMEGDATIETILDRSKKIQQVVSKQPTGKLASKDALNMARIILAQQSDQAQKDLENINQIITMGYNKINMTIVALLSTASTSITPSWTAPSAHPWWATALELIPGTQAVGIVLQFLTKYKDKIKDAQQDLKDSYNTYLKETSAETLQDIITHAETLQQIVSDMPDDAAAVKNKALKEIGDGIAILQDAARKWTTMGQVPTSAPAQPVSPLSWAEQKRQALIQKVDHSGKMTDAEKKQAFDWLTAQKDRLANPQTATQTATYIDQFETHLKSQGLIN